jgi:hypothetical protein
MALSPQAYALATCFHYLRGFQTACSFNTNVPAMNLLTFANSKISDILPSAPYQNQFLVAATANTGILVSQSDLTANTLFLDLLNQYRPLKAYFGNYLMSLAAPPYPSDTLQAFELVLTSAAFPGGSGGSQWQAVVAGLTSASPNIVPPECLTANLQAKLANVMNVAGTSMSSVISTIAVLG